MYRLKLDSIRNLMRVKGIDIYYIPTADFHESEYVIDYFKARAFMTGFTGSAGVAVVTMDKAGLWTDGRYFIQAQKQIAGTGFELYRMGNEGVPTVLEFMEENLPKQGCIGFDGRVVNTRDGEAFKAIAQKKGGRLETGEDLVDRIWYDRPPLKSQPAYYLDECCSGETPVSKLSRIRSCMKEAGADWHLVSSLDDVCWILNIRGNDIPHFPVILSYLAISGEEAVWFVDESCLDETIRRKMAEAGVKIAPYGDIYEYASELPADAAVMLDRGTVSYRICMSMPTSVRVIDRENPAVMMKAVKNSVETANIRKAHVMDGVAVTKFMYWLKKNIGKLPMTEISASDYLESLRAQQEGFLDISFNTICAYGENAAMMHYSASTDNNAVLEPRGFLLVDSGGHYKSGSTDITRTFALGELTQEQKKYFTLVAKGNLNLANARFLYGCTGINLDILSRGPLWKQGIDYQCGTGHGVGYLLSIHEKPNGIRWKFRRGSNCVLEEGMITTDEPGVYLEGEYGIRTENELLCVRDEKNLYGQFMRFENITYAPIDLDAVDPAYLEEEDKKQLNAYHKMVYETIAPYLEEDEKVWLREYTRAI